MTTLRGITAGAFTASSHTYALPAGSAAGDKALLFVAARTATINMPTTIGAWVRIWVNPGTGISGAVYARTLNAADITAGSVTANISVSEALYGAIVVASASAGFLVGQVMNPFNGSSAQSSDTLTVPLINGDVAIYFAATRRDSVTPTLTINTGTLGDESAVTNLAGGVRYENISSTADKTVTASYTTAGSGDFLLMAIFTDTARGGSLDTDYLAGAGEAVTAFLYKGRATASDDTGSVP